MRLGLFSALVAAALVTLHGDVSSSSVATAAVTCPLNYQTRLGSSLSTPMREEPDSKGSNKKDDKNNKNKNNKKKGSGSGSSNADVGDQDVGKGSGRGSGRGSGSGAGGVPRSTAPGVTTAPTGVPSSTAPTSSQPSSSSPSPTSAAPSSTRPTTTRPATTNGSNGGGEAGVPRGRVHGARRFLQANPPATTAPTTVRPGGLPDAGAPTPTPTPPPTGTLAPGQTTPAPAESNKSASSNSTGSGSAFSCDENFYKQWEANGIKCNGVSLDVAQAVAASRCVIYSGALGAIEGTSCVSICAFPACVNGQWDYSATNGISSEVYRSVGITKFMSAELTAEISKRTSGAAVLVGNTTLASTKQCDYASEDSFAACSCSKLSKDAPKSDAEIKKERQEDRQNGVISKDDTTTAGSIIAPTSQSVAGVTVFMSGVAAVASTVVSGSSAATASVAAAGANVAVVTVEICQFTVLINQLKLEGKSAALALFGKQMAPSAFTFLPFGKMNDGDDDMKKGRRLQAQTTADAGVSSYSRTLGIREDMLFVVTLAGVIVVMAGVVGLFGIAYGLSGLFMSREEFMNKFFDKMIGLQVLIAILSQYTIGVTATYQIHFSFQQNNPTDPKCILAIISLLVLAFGVIIYGYVVVKKHEDEIKDVGTATHINKKVCLRYGPIYEEYKYKHRFFFAAKMMLALVSGAATGYVAMEAKYQVSIILAAHVIFFFYLEMKAPHHSKFVQTTTSFVTIMKIATLALTFFLISAAASSDLPSELQNGISLAIVGLNLFVLFLLMVRSLYAFWKKYQLQRDAKFEEEEQSAAQEYFKDDTPARKNRVPKEQNPYLMGNAVQHEYNDAGDDIRLRSGTHMQESGNRYSYGDSAPRYDPSRSGGAQHYIANQRDTNPHYQQQQQQHHQQQQQQQYHQYQQVEHQYRRNDVVEL
ncbi:hypothetical protein PINS_up000040 [Pythium insidiosum]|nr:hypothetical protein PINS_up000040 [Pythium insidiosum]